MSAAGGKIYISIRSYKIMENQAPEINDTPEQQGTRSKLPIRSSSHKLAIILLIIVIILLIAAGIGAYLWRDMQANTQHSDDTAQINNLNSQVGQLKKDAAGAKNATPAAPKAVTKTPVSAAQRSNLADAIKSGNTAALEGFMAPSVHVIIAASEGVGDRTPVQAINDLSYTSAAVNPWDFNLDAATLAKYVAGSYKSYFLTDSLVGKSADGYVISFNFDAAGKISGIFMAKNESLLF